MDATTLQQIFQKGIEAFHQKQYSEAELSFKEVLKFIPQQREVLDFLGLVYFNQNNFSLAEKYFEAALAASNDFAIAYNHLASASFQLAHIEKAKLNYLKAIHYDPTLAEAYYNLGICFEAQNLPQKAIEAYEKEIELNKLQATSLKNLAFLYYKQNQYSLAANIFKMLWDTHSEKTEFALAYATCLQLSLQYEKALEVLESLPADPETLCSKANIFQELGKLEEAALLYEAIEGTCNREEYFVYYARSLISLNRSEEALIKINEGYSLYPQSLMLKVLKYLFLPVIYKNQEEIEEYRNKFQQGLDELKEDLKLGKISAKELLDIFQKRENFYLAYQGKNDCELQKQYAELYCLLIEKNKAQISEAKLPLKKHEKIHIAFVSPNFFTHSIASTTFGFLRYLNKDHFKIFLYHLGPKKADAYTEKMKAEADSYSYLPPHIPQIKAQIEKDEIDILFLADVGMDPITLNLAMHRLALVQCTTQGHPVTTGSPHMDYFFSAEDMERGIEAQEDYTEKLILLSGQGMAYPLISKMGYPKKNKKEFGFKQNSFVYLSCQSLYKYTPEFDWVYPEILKQIKNAQLAFVGHSVKSINDTFKQRLENEFKKAEVSFEEKVIILPRLSRQDFFDLLQCVDVYLDGLPWSGNNTTLEALAIGELPTVTRPGSQMRHRHTAAHLKKIKAPEGICNDLLSYIACARRLAEDADFYKSFKEKIIRNKSELFEDKKPVEEMGAFLRSAYFRLFNKS